MRSLLCAALVLGCGTRTPLFDPADDPWAADASADAARCDGPCPAGYIITVPPASQPFIDACGVSGAAAVLPNVDDNSVRLPLSFAFTYWGRPIAAGSQINVTSNGWFGMTGTSTTALQGTIPGSPTNAIAPFLVDLITRPAMCVATIGVAPQRQFVVEWLTVGYYANRTASLTFEAVLHETTNTIDFLYATMDGATPPNYFPAVGLNGASAAEGSAVCAGRPGLCASISTGTRIRFVPTP